MTGNIAQVFVNDEDWLATLASIRSALRPGGRLVFETRDSSKPARERWTKKTTWQRVDISGVGQVESRKELTEVALPLVPFRTTFVLDSDRTELTSDSTLRFWNRGEATALLVAAGFTVDDIRDAPDRPGLEMVFVATRMVPSPNEHL